MDVKMKLAKTSSWLNRYFHRNLNSEIFSDYTSFTKIKEIKIETKTLEKLVINTIK